MWFIMASLAVPNGLQAQPPTGPAVELVDLVVAGAATVLWMTPGLAELNRGAPGCLPCSRDKVPFFDRWAIAEPRGTVDDLSTAVLLGLGAGIAWDLNRHTDDPLAAGTAAAVSTWLAVGGTTLLRAAVARNRPVLYTAGAVELEDPGESRRSWPSRHAAGAFALATSYLLSHRNGRTSPGVRAAIVTAAVLVGGLRVAAAEHFPSDVLSGAALGVGSAFAVHALRF